MLSVFSAHHLYDVLRFSAVVFAYIFPCINHGFMVVRNCILACWVYCF